MSASRRYLALLRITDQDGEELHRSVHPSNADACDRAAILLGLGDPQHQFFWDELYVEVGRGADLLLTATVEEHELPEADPPAPPPAPDPLSLTRPRKLRTP